MRADNKRGRVGRFLSSRSTHALSHLDLIGMICGKPLHNIERVELAIAKTEKGNRNIQIETYGHAVVAWAEATMGALGACGPIRIEGRSPACRAERAASDA